MNYIVEAADDAPTPSQMCLVVKDIARTAHMAGHRVHGRPRLSNPLLSPPSFFTSRKA